jgi:hypothetical protein
MAGDGAAQPPEIVLDDEAKALKLEQAKAEARKAIIDANLSTAKSLVPTIDTTGLKSTFSMDEKGGSVVNAVAAAQLKEASKAIVASIKVHVPRNGRVILVEGRSIADADVPYKEFTNRLAWFKAEFESISTELEARGGAPPVGPTIAPIVPILLAANAATGILTTTLGLLGSDVSISGRTVSLDDTALKAVLAGELKTAGLVPVIEGLMSVKDTEMIGSFNALWDQYTALKD